MDAAVRDVLNAPRIDCDVVVVGGGSAGCVLAARLSEDPGCRVVLLEAGNDTPPGATPADIHDTFPTSTLNAGYLWPGLKASVRPGEAPRPWPQARVMGGGSSVMGMLALRGVPADYERWRAAGASGLGWADAQRLFERVRGQVPGGAASAMRTITPEEWPPVVGAMAQAAASKGWARADAEDAAGPTGDGFFAMPVSEVDGVRASAAHCYLTPQVRARANLRILANTQALRLVLEGRRVREVLAHGPSGAVSVGCARAVVAAGAIHTPVLLMRSGIGPASHLQRRGIAPLHDLRGVGERLQNHVYSFFALTLPRGKRLPVGQRRFAVAGLRASSGLPETPGDLFLFMLGRVSPRAFGCSVMMVASSLYAPFSRGHVRLAGPDPGQPPVIAFEALSDPRDAPRALQACRIAEQLVRSPGVAAQHGEAWLLPAGLAVNQFSKPGLAGLAMAAGATLALNAPAALRRLLMARAMPGARPLVAGGRAMELTDEQLLSTLSPMGHPAGTCAMGRADDPQTVVDHRHRVIGLANLFIADASVMPQLPSANTNLPTLMVAEHAAEQLRHP